MRASLRCLAVCVFLTATGVSACHARSRVWEAQVRQVRNAPCFAIADSPDARDHAAEIGALSVFEAAPGGREVWALESSRSGGLVVPAGECLEYGDERLGAKTIIPSSPLTAGKAYGLSINAKVNGNSPSKSYRAYFCLIPRASGNPVVHQVQWDGRTEQWRWDVCDLPNELSRPDV